jgi:hypothetical protein
MPFIETLSRSRAGAELAEAYRYLDRVAGTRIPGKIFELFGLRPSTMTRYIRNWELAMWACAEPRRNRELVAVAVSRLATCEY